MSLGWETEEASFEMVVSAGNVADQERVGMLSSLGEFSISHLNLGMMNTSRQTKDLKMVRQCFSGNLATSSISLQF